MPPKIVHYKSLQIFEYAILSLYRTFSMRHVAQDCNTSPQTDGCGNRHIQKLEVLVNSGNVGFSGNVNKGIKIMLEYSLHYALMSSDDVRLEHLHVGLKMFWTNILPEPFWRFRPGRLYAMHSVMHTAADVCIFNFEGYASFALTRMGIKKLGPMDENFWPAYAEDCDYWYRVQLVGCR